MERLLGNSLDSEADFQPRNGAQTGRSAASEPFPKPLRADSKGPNGEEHKAIQEGSGEREQSISRQGRRRKLPVSGDNTSDVHPTRRLLNIRGGVQEKPKRHVDYEAQWKGPRQGHLPSQQTQPAQEMGRLC